MKIIGGLNQFSAAANHTIIIHWYKLYYKMKYFVDILIGANDIDLEMMCQYTPQFSFDRKLN